MQRFFGFSAKNELTFFPLVWLIPLFFFVPSIPLVCFAWIPLTKRSHTQTYKYTVHCVFFLAHFISVTTSKKKILLNELRKLHVRWNSYTAMSMVWWANGRCISAFMTNVNKLSTIKSKHHGSIDDFQSIQWHRMAFFFAPPVFVSIQTIISCFSNWLQIEIAIAILRWNGCLDYFWRVFVSLFLLAIGQLRFFFGHNFNLNEIRLFRIWSLFFPGKS